VSPQQLLVVNQGLPIAAVPPQQHLVANQGLPIAAVPPQQLLVVNQGLPIAAVPQQDFVAHCYSSTQSLLSDTQSEMILNDSSKVFSVPTKKRDRDEIMEISDQEINVVREKLRFLESESN